MFGLVQGGCDMFDRLLPAHLFGSVVSQMNNLRLLLPANNYGWR